MGRTTIPLNTDMSERRFARGPSYEDPHYEAIFDVENDVLIWRCRECRGTQQGTVSRDFALQYPTRRPEDATFSHAADCRYMSLSRPERTDELDLPTLDL